MVPTCPKSLAEFSHRVNMSRLLVAAFEADDLPSAKQ